MFTGFYLLNEFAFHFEDMLSLAILQDTGKVALDFVVPVRATFSLTDDEYFYAVIGGVKLRLTD